MTNEERIKADAEAYANGVGDVYRKYASLYGYIAGATAEHDRAQVLVDALEAIAGISMPVPNKADMIEIAKKHLEQWKGEKESEAKEQLIPTAVYKQVGSSFSLPDRPCPHCGKELSRDRNLCCRECGKEVGDENT